MTLPGISYSTKYNPLQMNPPEPIARIIDAAASPLPNSPTVWVRYTSGWLQTLPVARIKDCNIWEPSTDEFRRTWNLTTRESHFM